MNAHPVAVVDLLEEVRGDEDGDAGARPRPGSAPRRGRGCATSTPAVGSSRKSTRGWCSVLSARPARWRMPAGRSSGCSRLGLAEREALAQRAPALLERRAVEAVEAGVELDVLAQRQPLVEAHLLPHVADVVAHPARVADDVDAVDLDRARRSARAGRSACGWSCSCPSRWRRGRRRSSPARRAMRRGRRRR